MFYLHKCLFDKQFGIRSDGNYLNSLAWTCIADLLPWVTRSSKVRMDFQLMLRDEKFIRLIAYEDT